MSNIEFQGGLELNKIINNIDGQGKYKWLLEADTENLVVSLEQSKLSIKSGTWHSGNFYG